MPRSLNAHDLRIVAKAVEMARSAVERGWLCDTERDFLNLVRDRVSAQCKDGGVGCEHKVVSDLLEWKWESVGINCIARFARELGETVEKLSGGRLFSSIAIDSLKMKVNAELLAMQAPAHLAVRLRYGGDTVAELSLTARVEYSRADHSWHLSFDVHDVKFSTEVLAALCAEDPLNIACRRHS